MLRDSISNLPVIIVEKKKLVGIVDEFILNNIDNILNGKWLDDGNQTYFENKLRIIPFCSLGNENGILIGFKPDYIKIYMEDDIFQKEAIIGIYQGILCGNTNDYHAIVGL